MREWITDLWYALHANWVWLPLWLRVGLLVAAGGAFVIYTAFPLVFAYEGARKAGIWQPRGPTIVAYIWAGVAPLANLIHNVLIATLIFRDCPREGATSKRIQRYMDRPAAAGWRYAKALKWARWLNWHDPGHISNVPQSGTEK